MEEFRGWQHGALLVWRVVENGGVTDEIELVLVDPRLQGRIS